MRKWLRITRVVGLGVLLVVAGALFAIWEALQWVPEFYQEAMVVTPAIQKGADGETIPRATAPPSDGRQEVGCHALFARAIALAQARQGQAAAPDLREEVSDKVIPPATAPPRDPGQEGNSDALFTRRPVLASSRESQVVPAAFQEKASDKVVQQPTPTAGNELIGRPTAPAGGRVQEAGWNALFTAEDINGWLAAHLGRNLAEEAHGSLNDLRVAIDPDCVAVGCRLRRGRVDTVLSLTGDAYLAGENVVAVRIRTARAGALPLSMDRYLDRISRAASRSGLEVRWQRAGRDPVALIRLPLPRNEANRLARIDALRLAPGRIYLSGSTE